MLLLILLCCLAIALTYAMFVTRESMLGFPCGIFWGLSGGQAYTLHTTTWDMYYFLFFAAIGMLIFAIFAAFGLREKRDAIGDEEMEQGDDKDLIDGNTKAKASSDIDAPEDKPEVSRVRQGVRERADARRGKRIRRKINWGEFR